MTTQEAILTRKSVRGFTKEQLTEDELKNILDAAYASPIAGTLYKTMRLTVVQKQEILDQISDFYKEAGEMKADMLFGAPALIAPHTRLSALTGAHIHHRGVICEDALSDAAVTCEQERVWKSPGLCEPVEGSEGAFLTVYFHYSFSNRSISVTNTVAPPTLTSTG